MDQCRARDAGCARRGRPKSTDRPSCCRWDRDATSSVCSHRYLLIGLGTRICPLSSGQIGRLGVARCLASPVGSGCPQCKMVQGFPCPDRWVEDPAPHTSSPTSPDSPTSQPTRRGTMALSGAGEDLTEEFVGNSEYSPFYRKGLYRPCLSQGATLTGACRFGRRKGRQRIQTGSGCVCVLRLLNRFCSRNQAVLVLAYVGIYACTRVIVFSI